MVVNIWAVMPGVGGLDYGVDVGEGAGKGLVEVDVLAGLHAADGDAAAPLNLRRGADDLDVEPEGVLQGGHVGDSVLPGEPAVQLGPVVRDALLVRDRYEAALGVGGEDPGVALLVGAAAPNEQYSVFGQFFSPPYSSWYRAPRLPTSIRSSFEADCERETVMMAPWPMDHCRISVT